MIGTLSELRIESVRLRPSFSPGIREYKGYATARESSAGMVIGLRDGQELMQVHSNTPDITVRQSAEDGSYILAWNNNVQFGAMYGAIDVDIQYNGGQSATRYRINLYRDYN